MANSWTSRFLGFILVGGTIFLTATGRAEAGDSFSVKNLRGSYVFKTKGWNRGSSGSPPFGDSLAPFDAVGVLTFDGAGHLAGRETVNIIFNTNGTPTAPSTCNDSSSEPSVAICVYDIGGTYTVDADGTAIWDINRAPIQGSDCRCGNRMTEFAAALAGNPREVTRRVLYVTRSSQATGSGEAERRPSRKPALDP